MSTHETSPSADRERFVLPPEGNLHRGCAPVIGSLDEKCVNTIRFLSVDMVEKAKSGHPGLPLGAAPMAYVLFRRFLRHNPKNPGWVDRDRFVLSAGHGSALLYSLLHLTGYDLPLEELQRFRQLGSKTPGHPEYGLTPGVEATTGPLGQGFAMGLGMAAAERFLEGVFNRPGFPIVDHRVFAIVSDGDLMEGIASEAASLAGTMGLGRLVYLYDDNHVSLEGGTELAFTEDVEARFRGYHWDVYRVPDGNDLAAIDRALSQATSQEAHPSLIIVRTHIGFGSPKQDTFEAHGEPLGPAATEATKKKLGWPTSPPFLIPAEVAASFREVGDRGGRLESEWAERFANYRRENPQLAEAFEAAMDGRLPQGWDAGLPQFAPADGPMATRDASSKVLRTLADRIPTLIGGSADLTPSTKTALPGQGDLGIHNGFGRNIHFGVRENAMVGVLNGMAVHGGVRPYGATFLTFSDYAKPAIRIGALMRARNVVVFTHDSIGLGEDGPTHQPVEHLWALRSIPHVTVIRPADANEASVAWRLALMRSGPTLLIFTRQKLPILDPAVLPVLSGSSNGGYVLREAQSVPPSVIIAASGSEVSLALEAQAQLEASGTPTRVVSIPCTQIFDEQSPDYRRTVLPSGIPVLAVEAGSPVGWWKYVGHHGDVFGIDRFGLSAPGAEVMRAFGFTPENIADHVRSMLQRVRGPA